MAVQGIPILMLAVACLLASSAVAREVPVPGSLVQPEHHVTNLYAVRLVPSAVADDVALSMRLRVARALPFVDHYLLEVPGQLLVVAGVHAMVEELLSSSAHVLWYERQISRQQFKRDTPVLPPSDPSYSAQWNLHGNAQASINVEAAWARNTTGEGILISVVDDGLDYHNRDIADHYVPEASYDINYNDNDPTPSSWDSHGTETAGTCCAIADDGYCGAGVAPMASIAAIRLIARNTMDSDEAAGLTYALDMVDIYSNSWGPYDDGKRLEAPGTLTQAALEEGIASGRDGRGAIYVWAGGNGLANADNCNYDGYANSRYTVAVAAVDFYGRQTYYSEPCAAHVISTPSSDSSGHGITATSLNNACVDNFGGTSASCPMVAGTVALMLEKRPELTWRDVQGVLLTTAAQNDPSDSEWAVNGAGLHVSHKYGYGLLDAGAAVAAAEQWELLGQYQSYNSGTLSVSEAIPDRGRGSVTRSHAVSVDFFVEHVEVVFSAQHSYRGQLQVELTSPLGTTSVLSTPHADSNSNYDAWRFASMRYWGEVASGQWSIAVTDGTSGTTGTFQSWALRIYGHY